MIVTTIYNLFYIAYKFSRTHLQQKYVRVIKEIKRCSVYPTTDTRMLQNNISHIQQYDNICIIHHIKPRIIYNY